MHHPLSRKHEYSAWIVDWCEDGHGVGWGRRPGELGEGEGTARVDGEDCVGGGVLWRDVKGGWGRGRGMVSGIRAWSGNEGEDEIGWFERTEDVGGRACWRGAV